MLSTKLGNFSGTSINKNQVQLNWQSLTEVNSHSFNIEKSIDGINFTTAGYRMAACNNVSPVNYSFTDKNVAAGKIFYRLKQADNNGSFVYSKVIEVNTQLVNTPIAVYPNPAGSYTIFNHPFGGNNDQYRLICLNGRIILQKKITSDGMQTRIDLTQFAKGAYRIVWTNGKDIISNSLLII